MTLGAKQKAPSLLLPKDAVMTLGAKQKAPSLLLLPFASLARGARRCKYGRENLVLRQ